MTDEPEQLDDEMPDVEYVDPCVQLGDGECWISDPDALDPAAECGAGVIAVQFREGALWYMTAQDHKWVNAEHKASPRKLAAIKGDKP